MQLDSEQFVQTIRKAWISGRPIVPIIGAGVSADSGFPPLTSIVRYIAKLCCYLENGFYLPLTADKSLFKSQRELFARRPDTFISVFGWPDRFELNAALRARLSAVPQGEQYHKQLEDDPRRSTLGLMDVALCQTLDKLTSKINPGGYWQVDNYLRETVGNAVDLIESAASKGSQAAIQGIPTSEQGRFNTTSMFLSKQFDAILSSLTTIREPTNVLSFRYKVAGDWKPLLRHVAWYQPELVDSLFSRFARGRSPGTQHTMLAHLAQLLRIRSLFTFNFDPFLETAFVRENISHRVFSMEHGTELPSRHHLDESISIIKMHGSTHNILVDERVDYRVSERYKQQFLSLIGQAPLLLVMGCSGNDRRLVDLVGDVLDDVEDATAVWIHHAKTVDVPTALKSHKCLSYHGTYDIGNTLQRLFENLTDRLPNATAPYVAHVNRPTIRAEKNQPKYELHKRAVTLFAHPNTPRTPFAGDRRYLHALAEVPLGYTPILVDLEEHHTLEQVVADAIDQIRRGDTSLPPFVTSTGVSDSSGPNPLIDKHYAALAAERIVRAIQRSRYALCFSGIDAFIFRPTTHHGVTSASDSSKRFDVLCEFLRVLAERIAKEWTLGDSFLVLAYEQPYQRHERNRRETKTLAALHESFGSFLMDCQRAVEQAANLGFDKFVFVRSDPRTDPRYQEEQRRSVAAETDNEPFYLPAQFECSRWINKPRNTLAQATSGADMPPRSVLSIEHAVTGFLACYRRTRTKLGLKHLFQDLFDNTSTALQHTPNVPNLAESVLKHLSASDSIPPWIVWTNEEGLWLDRPTRDWIYDFNTRFTATDMLQDRDNRPLALVQALFAAVAHDRIARTYYLRQYLPSRDPFHFLEYVYHRISTLRYLALIQAMSFFPDWSNNVKNAAKHTPLWLEDIANPDFGTLQSYSDSPDWQRLFTRLRTTADVKQTRELNAESGNWQDCEDILAIRSRCMRGLMETWQREEPYIRSVLPPDEVVMWCENVLGYNLGVENEGADKHKNDRTSAAHSSFINAFVRQNATKPVQEALKCLRKFEKEAYEDDQSVTHTDRTREKNKKKRKTGLARKKLIAELRDTAFRAMYAHASYKKIESDTWLLGEESESDAEGLNWKLNRQIANLWHLIEKLPPTPFHDSAADACFPQETDKTHVKEFLDFSKVITDQTSSIITFRDKWPDSPEARLRALYLGAEVGLLEHLDLPVRAAPLLPCESYARDRIKGMIGKTTGAIELVKTKIIKLDTKVFPLLHRAIEEAREQISDGKGHMRNPLLEPTADRGLFIPYRSLFQTLLGRTQLATARLLNLQARLEVEVHRLTCDGSETHDEKAYKEAANLMKKSRDHLTAAYRELAYAKHGIGEENSPLLAIADLCSADVAIEGSDHAVALFYRKDWRSGKLMVRRAQAKLGTASRYLNRCLSRLVQGPRFILLRRFFHLIQVQYHIRRIMSIADEVTCAKKLGDQVWSSKFFSEESNARRIGELSRRVGLAVLGIRFGADYSIGADPAGFRARFLQLWAQVAASAFYAGAVMAHANRFTATSLIDTLLSSWIDINEMEGVFSKETGQDPRLIHIARLDQIRAAVRPEFDKLMPLWDNISDLGGVQFMRDHVSCRFSKNIYRFVSAGEGKDWMEGTSLGAPKEKRRKAPPRNP